MGVFLLQLAIAVLMLANAEYSSAAALLYGEEWKQWKEEHSVLYASIEEEMYRYSIWLDNMKYIIQHNDKNLSFTLKMNQFGDLVSAMYDVYTCTC